MPTSDHSPVLNPSIVGQAEKAHNAVLDLVLDGTPLDEKSWITLQLAAAWGGAVSTRELVSQVQSKAKFAASDVQAALDQLTDAGLVTATEAGLVAPTGAGTALIAQVRAHAAQFIKRAYSQVPDGDLAVAARVLTRITAALSEDLAAR